MSDILIRNRKMPKDCPMCPMAHYDTLNHFRGCEVVPGKRHAINDPNYANTSIRPDWCPLVEVPTPHGRLIDADALLEKHGDWYTEEGTEEGFIGALKYLIAEQQTIIEGEYEK